MNNGSVLLNHSSDQSSVLFTITSIENHLAYLKDKYEKSVTLDSSGQAEIQAQKFMLKNSKEKFLRIEVAKN